MMKKGAIFLLAIALLFSMSLGFINDRVMAQDTRTARMAIYGPLDIWEVQGGAALVFRDHIERHTDIEIDIYPDRQLGGDDETVRGADTGSIEIVWASDGGVSSFVPAVNVLGLPYLFPNEVIAWEVLDGWMGDQIKDVIESTLNVYVGGIAQNGFRSFTNNVRPIKTPEDMEGLRIRTMFIEAHQKIVESLGATPVPMSGDEEYTALEQGVIDGEENAPWWVYTANFYEVLDYMTLDAHVYGVHIYLMNADFIDSLDPYERAIVFEAARKAEITQRGINEAMNNAAVEWLEEEGMEIYTPTEEEIEKFREATVGPVSEWMRGQIGEEWVNDMYEATEEAIERFYGDKTEFRP